LREAIPYLDELSDHLDQRKAGFEPTLNAIQTAVHNIDPHYGFLYLDPPYTEELQKILSEAVAAVGTTDVSLETYFQYLTERRYVRVTRIRAMVEACSADPQLNESFVSKVVSNPMLQSFAEQIGVHLAKTGSAESR
jgi:16S rRNA G966 N2-methylase RsmD